MQNVTDRPTQDHTGFLGHAEHSSRLLDGGTRVDVSRVGAFTLSEPISHGAEIGESWRGAKHFTPPEWDQCSVQLNADPPETFEVEHRYSDGAIALMTKVFERVSR